MRPSADAIAMMIRREKIPANGAYDTVKSTPSIMIDPSAHVLEYKLSLFSMSVVFTLKPILGISILYLVVIRNVKMVH